MRAADGVGSSWVKKLALADDFENTPGLTFWEAQRRAVELHRGGADDHGKLANVGEALAAFRRDLIARGGDPANADRIKFHLTPSLGSKPVATLNARELMTWRDLCSTRARARECDAPLQVVVSGTVLERRPR